MVFKLKFYHFNNDLVFIAIIIEYTKPKSQLKPTKTLLFGNDYRADKKFLT